MDQEYVVRTAPQLVPVVRGFRSQRNLTQTELAKKLGISQTAYSELERNAQRISVARLLKLLAALDVDLVLRDRRTAVPLSVGETPPEW